MVICGIAGLWNRHRATRPQEIEGMLDALWHRGPDDFGMFHSQQMAFGMRRLAVMDVECGRQPYRSENGRIIAVYNGELYNYPELKQLVQSRGHHLTSHADGEVIVHLYEEFGPEFVRKLIGMYAIAIWDAGTQQLFLARDPVGQKPLYIWDRGQSLAFSSELKAFNKLEGYRPEVDTRFLAPYLAHRFVPAPHTLIRGVSKLEPGESLMVFKDGRRQRVRFWEPPTGPVNEPSRPMEDWVDQLDATMSRVMARHLPSDVPMGIFLSGGLDSSLLAALSARHGRVLEAWAAVFPDNYPGYDESHYAEQVAASLGMVLHRVPVDTLITPERLRELAFVMDEPMADPTVLPLDGIARAAAEKDTVIISGEGADEIFAGYAGYGEVASLERLRRIPQFVRDFWSRQGWPGSGAFGRLREPLHHRYRGVGFTFSPEEQAALLHHSILTSDRPAALREYWQRAGELEVDGLQMMQGFDVRWFLPDDVLLKADRIGMHYHLEVRVPYCDQELVELALSMPSALRRNAKEDKRVLRKVADRYLPSTIVHRRKRGFPTPLTQLLGGPLREMAFDVLTSQRWRGRQWFNSEPVESLLAAMGPENPTAARQVYALLMLELWVQEVVEAPSRELNNVSAAGTFEAGNASHSASRPGGSAFRV